MRATALCTFAPVVLSTAIMPAIAQQKLPNGRADRDFFRRHLADYDAELRGWNGRVDVDVLLRRLKELRVTTYYWLIYHARTDWDDLQLFVPKAAAAGIDVWVYLVPPSESAPKSGSTYPEPFRLDYLRWAEEIAKLSLKHANVKAWVIDDFYQNQSLFTPDYVRRMQAAVKRLNPELRFLPLMYFPEIRPKFVDRYREVVDGVVIAYPRDRAEIDAAWAILNGVRTSHPGQMGLDHYTPTRAGDYAAASQEATVLAAPRYVIGFDQREDFVGKTAGYHFKQLLVDGVVAWEEDAAGGDIGWEPRSIDVTKLVHGKRTISVTFRLYDKKGVSAFGVRWDLRGLRLEGLRVADGLDRPDRWTASHQGPIEVGFGAELKTNPPQFHVPFICMTAGEQDEFRMRHGDPASPQRLAQWVEMCLEAWRDGRCDGVVTYCLDKRPGSGIFSAVRDEFQKFRSVGFPGDSAHAQPANRQQVETSSSAGHE